MLMLRWHASFPVRNIRVEPLVVIYNYSLLSSFNLSTSTEFAAFVPPVQYPTFLTLLLLCC